MKINSIFTLALSAIVLILTTQINADETNENATNLNESNHTHQHNEHEHHHEEHSNTEKDTAHQHEHHDEQNHEHQTRIKDELAEEAGIFIARVQSQTLLQTSTLYGQLTVGPEQLSHVRARFEGLVKSVNVTVGDRVQAGDLLAQIESNESLKNYDILAPISGLIIQRHANTGEVTGEQTLFSIADFSSLWAELKVFPKQQARIKENQQVQFNINHRIYSSHITNVLPVLDEPYQLARINLNNNDLSLSPGLIVASKVHLGSFDAAMAVKNEAIQTLEGKTGVFVKHEDNYEFVPVVLGRSDMNFTEVISGLTVGTQYVSHNSYLLKADIKKSQAEHHH